MVGSHVILPKYYNPRREVVTRKTQLHKNLFIFDPVTGDLGRATYLSLRQTDKLWGSQSFRCWSRSPIVCSAAFSEDRSCARNKHRFLPLTARIPTDVLILRRPAPYHRLLRRQLLSIIATNPSLLGSHENHLIPLLVHLQSANKDNASSTNAKRRTSENRRNSNQVEKNVE